MLVNGEDCALTSSDKSAGRRGLCGTMFLFKILGAMAERGDRLELVAAEGRELSSCMGTMGTLARWTRQADRAVACLPACPVQPAACPSMRRHCTAAF